MTKAAALEQARALLEFESCGNPKCVRCNDCQKQVNKLAAAQLRAYANGFEDGRNWSRIVTTETLDPPSVFRAAADAMERGEREGT